MNRAMAPEWRQFYETTKDRGEPRPILIEALELVEGKGKALDVGAGGLNETKYLLGKGFEVTAVDSEPAVAQAAAALVDKRLHFYAVGLEDFNYPGCEFDLAVALYSLPFVAPGRFESVIAELLASVKPGGVFAGNFFGENDEWNDGINGYNFVAKDAVLNFFKNIDVAKLEEEKDYGTTSDG